MENKKILNKQSVVISAAVVVLLVLSLILFGYVSVSFKKPQQRVVLAGRVCDDTVVARFNKVIEVQQGKDSYGTDESGLNALASEIKNKTGYQNDATCQTILLVAAVQKQDYNAAKTAYDSAKSLHNKHVYADSDLNGVNQLSSYETFVQELSPSHKSVNSQEPQGGA